MAKLDMEALQVLVIDDEPFMRQLLIRVLKDLQIERVEQANNGEEGLKKVEESGWHYDIILCDLDMPGMGGFEFVRMLRHLSDSDQAQIPVLIITGRDDEQSVRNAAMRGIQGYLVKPINAKSLEERILSAVISSPVKPKTAKE